METRFILPITLATAFHVLVLFGTRATSNPPGDSPPVTKDPLPRPFVINIDDPIEQPPEPTLGAAPAKGNPDSYLPHLDETPPRPSIDEQPAVRVSVHPDPGLSRIITGPIGLPDGVINGEEQNIINSRYLDNSPRTRLQVPPTYPAEARNAGITGAVTVEFVVDEQGRVQLARVVESTDARFEAATLRAVQKWRFEPGKKNGRPVRFRMVAPVVFNLDT